ncbi:MAG: amidase domain-containing protein [Bacillota bacterium]|jgi:hypothetical protein
MPSILQVRTRYNRRRAVSYALSRYNNPNPKFANMDQMGSGGDCTNFTSQCLLVGGFQMDFRETGQATEWWYRHVDGEPFDQNHDDWWSCTWSLPETQFQYLAANQGQVGDLLQNPSLARRLERGDLIYYDWDGEGRFGHSAIVTAKSRSGVPYVTYRTLQPLRPQRNVHWTLRFRRQAARIYAIHLTDRPIVYQVPPDYSRLIPCEQDRRRD